MSNAKDKIDGFLRALGLLVVSWNRAERQLTELLRRVIVDSKALDILTAHMTAEAKEQALRVCADEMPSGDVRDRLLHFCKFFAILRDWRNHYVHNTGSSFGVGEEVVGFTRQMKARHRLIIRDEHVTTKDLERTAMSCRGLSDFAYRLDSFLFWQGRDASNVRLADGSEISLPEMPPLPLSLEESRKPPEPPKPRRRSSPP